MGARKSMFMKAIALTTLWIFLFSNVSFALRPAAFGDRTAHLTDAEAGRLFREVDIRIERDADPITVIEDILDILANLRKTAPPLRDNLVRMQNLLVGQESGDVIVSRGEIAEALKGEELSREEKRLLETIAVYAQLKGFGIALQPVVIHRQCEVPPPCLSMLMSILKPAHPGEALEITAARKRLNSGIQVPLGRNDIVALRRGDEIIVRGQECDVVVVGSGMVDYVVDVGNKFPPGAPIEGLHLTTHAELEKMMRPIPPVKLKPTVGGPGLAAAMAVRNAGGEKLRVAMNTSVGNDERGELLIGYIEGNGIDASGIQKVAGQKTAVTFIPSGVITVDGRERHVTAFFHAPGASNKLDKRGLKYERGRVWHIGGIALNFDFMRNDLLPALVDAKREGVITVMDTVVDPQGIWKELEQTGDADKICRNLDVLTISQKEGEIDAFIDFTAHPDLKNNPEGIIRYFLDKGIKTVIVKLGEDGCMVGSRGSPIFADTEPARMPVYSHPDYKVIGGTGMGDAFSAAVSIAAERDYTLGDTVAFATAVASKAGEVLPGGGDIGPEKDIGAMRRFEELKQQPDVKDAMARIDENVARFNDADSVKLGILLNDFMALFQFGRDTGTKKAEILEMFNKAGVECYLFQIEDNTLFALLDYIRIDLREPIIANTLAGLVSNNISEGTAIELLEARLKQLGITAARETAQKLLQGLRDHVRAIILPADPVGELKKLQEAKKALSTLSGELEKARSRPRFQDRRDAARDNYRGWIDVLLPCLRMYNPGSVDKVPLSCAAAELMSLDNVLYGLSNIVASTLTIIEGRIGSVSEMVQANAVRQAAAPELSPPAALTEVPTAMDAARKELRQLQEAQRVLTGLGEEFAKPTRKEWGSVEALKGNYLSWIPALSGFVRTYNPGAIKDVPQLLQDVNVRNDTLASDSKSAACLRKMREIADSTRTIIEAKLRTLQPDISRINEAAELPQLSVPMQEEEPIAPRKAPGLGKADIAYLGGLIGTELELMELQKGLEQQLVNWTRLLSSPNRDSVSIQGQAAHFNHILRSIPSEGREDNLKSVAAKWRWLLTRMNIHEDAYELRPLPDETTVELRNICSTYVNEALLIIRNRLNARAATAGYPYYFGHFDDGQKTTLCDHVSGARFLTGDNKHDPVILNTIAALIYGQITKIEAKHMLTERLDQIGVKQPIENAGILLLLTERLYRPAGAAAVFTGPQRIISFLQASALLGSI